METEIMNLDIFEKRINDGEDIEVDKVLIRLPDGQVMSFNEYIEGGYNVKYHKPDPEHIISPLHKKKKPVPKGVGSNKKVKRYWNKWKK